MLEVLSMFLYQSRAKFDQCFSELRDQVGADKIFHGLLFFGLAEDVDIKLTIRLAL